MQTERHRTEEISIVVFNFNQLLEAEIADDKRRYNETNPHYGVYRALKETLRSEQVNKMNLTKSDYYSISGFLFENELTAGAFREWIRTREPEWELNLLPRNARRLFALGKQEILKRNGKK